MRLQNTSRYPTDEVRSLIAFATRGVDLAGVAVHVKNNNQAAYAGRAYHDVPTASPRRWQVSVDRLVTIRIGPPEKFPTDNLGTYRRWRAVSDAELATMPEDERQRLRYWSASDGRHGQQCKVVTRHPYGGLRSPTIEMADWREGLISVAAHEARHVYQFQHGKPTSEVDAERFAAKALARWRAA